MANVALIDQQVGNIMAALSARGLLENAVVIFTSDHGDALGDHGAQSKMDFLRLCYPGTDDCLVARPVHRRASD